jgi:PBP1b-binding outer membrane lipoprotein LpoB
MKNSRAALPAILLIAALSLAGCSSAGSSSSSSSGSSGTASRSDAQSPETLTDGSVKAADLPGATKSVDRSVIVTGTVTVTAGDPIASAAKAIAIVEGAGGRIDGRTENAATNGDRGSATLVLRIPAAKLSATLDALKKLGRADRVQLDSTDVTTQSQDLDARITASRATIARLLQLESTATDTTNLIAIETAIGDRQAELESMEAQQRGLADQVSMSTVTLQLRSDAAAPPIKPADFWSGLGTGWQAFAGFWAAVLVAFGVLIPWLALAGVGAGAVLLVRRTVRRRSAARPTATPPAPIG